MTRPSPADVDRVFASAVVAGGAVEVGPRDEPWGAWFAAVTDPFSRLWGLHAPNQGLSGGRGRAARTKAPSPE